MTGAGASLTLRLAGPLQSWGGPVTRTRDNRKVRAVLRPTERVPTRSGVLGLLAAALGIGRDDPLPDWFEQVDLDRIDVVDPGTVYWDFHMVHPSEPLVHAAQQRRRVLDDATARAGASRTVVRNRTRLEEERVAAGEAPKVPGEAVPVGAAIRNANGKLSTQGALITRRAYLAGAEFHVRVTHPDPERVEQLRAAVHRPVFDLYLGRKACPASFPLLLDPPGRAS